MNDYELTVSIVYLFLFGRIILCGFENVFLKKLGDGHDDYVVNFWYFFIAGMVVLPSLLLFCEWQPKNWDFLVFPYLSAFMYLVGITFLIKSLRIADISLVAPFYNLNSFFLLLFGVIFLDEKFTYLKIGALGAIFLGMILVKGSGTKTIIHAFKGLFIQRECQFMFLCALFMSAGMSIDRCGLSIYKEINKVLYVFCIMMLVSLYLLIYIFYAKKCKLAINLGRKHYILITLLGGTNSYGYICLLIATSKPELLELSVAESVAKMSTLVSILLGPLFFKEKIKKVFYRMIGAIVILIGVWILIGKC